MVTNNINNVEIFCSFMEKYVSLPPNTNLINDYLLNLGYMKKKLYEKPAMQVVRFQSMPMMDMASPQSVGISATMSVTYEEEDW